MAYATDAAFRALTPFSTNEISAADVTTLIAHADRAIIKYATTEKYMERLRGKIDGTNKDFITKFNPLADTDADSDVDGDDVSAFLKTWDDDTGFDAFASAAVTSVDARTGVITLTTAPTTTTAEAGVYATYSIYHKGAIDYDSLILAANYFLAYLAANKIEGEAPRYSVIDAAQRKDVTGSEWLNKCLELLRLAVPFGLKNVVSKQRYRGGKS